MVEAVTIWDGLFLYEEHNITNIVLEFNLRVLVDMLCVDSCPH